MSPLERDTRADTNKSRRTTCTSLMEGFVCEVVRYEVILYSMCVCFNEGEIRTHLVLQEMNVNVACDTPLRYNGI